ncbi:sterol desaturase family protein [Aquincola sp. S2]|uniref:Sterol desaturase family protein n=1 Tax=Pseudaquabacterium terrae TaxID=2732868 RepID=A0ABX2EBV1_9BURK|nr:sterol desaturase family protein [Aquabacterium terrae]NRF66636.1 sterol desaturase family protein [Aquabacterium terrae]
MAEALLGLAGPLYLAALIGGFAAMALWETVRPLRPASVPLAPRWINNLGLLFINQAVMRLALPLAGLSVALLAASRGWGLLPLLEVPAVLAVPLAVVMLDGVRWAAHRAMHWPGLWRLHRVHHSDLDFDCTIELRFHPGEALLAQALLSLAIVALGAPPLAVLLSDLLTLVCGYFTHANVQLPPRLERVLRSVLITPDLHRVHHSARVDESMSNYGVLLSVWDRWFGSYRAHPADDHLGMQFGLAELREPRQLTLARLLWLPFRR